MIHTIVSLAVTVGLLAAPAGQMGTPVSAVIVDPPGDANGLNGSVVEEGPDTRPASDDRADILRIWPETTFDAVQERASDGTILAVRHVPVALRINVETLAPAMPATGPTLMFRLPVQAGGCYFEMRFHVHGPLSAPDDPPQVVDLNRMPSGSPECWGDEPVEEPGFELGADGNVTWMELPFDAVAGTPAQSAIAPGVEMTANGNPYFWPRRRIAGSTVIVLVGGPIDVAHPLPPYVIGSDIPADIDCAVTPGAAGCHE